MAAKKVDLTKVKKIVVYQSPGIGEERRDERKKQEYKLIYGHQTVDLKLVKMVNCI